MIWPRGRASSKEFGLGGQCGPCNNTYYENFNLHMKFCFSRCASIKFREPIMYCIVLYCIGNREQSTVGVAITALSSKHKV